MGTALEMVIFNKHLIPERQLLLCLNSFHSMQILSKKIVLYKDWNYKEEICLSSLDLMEHIPDFKIAYLDLETQPSIKCGIIVTKELSLDLYNYTIWSSEENFTFPWNRHITDSFRDAIRSVLSVPGILPSEGADTPEYIAFGYEMYFTEENSFNKLLSAAHSVIIWAAKSSYYAELHASDFTIMYNDKKTIIAELLE